MALPLSVSDMLKLLDAIPAWKALIGLPRRLADIEARVAALEARRAAGGKECPRCGQAMKVSAVTPDPLFGQMGVQRHTLECPACGHAENRQVDPPR